MPPNKQFTLPPPRVFVVQEPRRLDPGSATMHKTIDLSPAEDYGALHFLFSDDRPPRDQNAVILHLMRALDDFTENDYLLPTGAPCLIVWAGIIAANKTGGRLQLLEWERRPQQYRVVRADWSGVAMLQQGAA